MKRITSVLLCIVILLSLSCAVCADEWKNPFTDVKEGEWYYESVKYVNSNNLFAGMSDTIFGTNVNMNRAMFVTVLGRLDGAEDNRNQKTAFTDVPTGLWYSGYVSWASENGIVYGKTETTFDPTAPITREDMCVIIKRYANYIELNLDKTEDSITFDDEATISSYAKAPVKELQEAGIIYGMGSLFSPKGLSTRAQVAAVIKRTALLIEKANHPEEITITDAETRIMLTYNKFSGGIASYALAVKTNSDNGLIAAVTSEYGKCVTYDISVTKNNEAFPISGDAEIAIPFPSDMTAKTTIVCLYEDGKLIKTDAEIKAGTVSLTGGTGIYVLISQEWTPNY